MFNPLISPNKVKLNKKSIKWYYQTNENFNFVIIDKEIFYFNIFKPLAVQTFVNFVDTVSFL